MKNILDLGGMIGSSFADPLNNGASPVDAYCTSCSLTQSPIGYGNNTENGSPMMWWAGTESVASVLAFTDTMSPNLIER